MTPKGMTLWTPSTVNNPLQWQVSNPNVLIVFLSWKRRLISQLLSGWYGTCCAITPSRPRFILFHSGPPVSQPSYQLWMKTIVLKLTRLTCRPLATMTASVIWIECFDGVCDGYSVHRCTLVHESGKISPELSGFVKLNRCRTCQMLSCLRTH